MSHEPDSESREDGPTWRYIALGACALVVSVGGLALGLWSKSLDTRLDDIRDTQNELRRIINDRADLPPRVTELEAGQKTMKEQVRILERQADRNGWK